MNDPEMMLLQLRSLQHDLRLEGLLGMFGGLGFDSDDDDEIELEEGREAYDYDDEFF